MSIEDIYRTESRQVLATLVRLLGDFDLAEDAMHDAFAVAVQKWPSDGFPDNPRAWLISTARFKAIDSIRRQAKFNASLATLAEDIERAADAARDQVDEAVKDDQLRLIFTCCHPLLSPESRTALTLREVCGLTTEEIARAFLASPPTIAQRIVRAKSKIREAKIPYQVPGPEELPDRLDTVLQVVYLVFNEGYYASAGDSLTRADLSGEAIRLGRLILDLLPDPEAMGLLALMLIQESRRAARSTHDGHLILLEDQDRSLWNQSLIAEGIALVERVLASRRFGPYTIQGAIAAVHAEAKTPSDTDWPQIVALYDLLLRIVPSPIIQLNRAVAVAMKDGPEHGLTVIDQIVSNGDLEGYSLLHATRADFFRRLGRIEEAIGSYSRARELAQQGPEQKFLDDRLASLKAI